MTINACKIESARVSRARRSLCSSPACVYPHQPQGSPGVLPIEWQNSCPADPEKNSGLERLAAEKLHQYFNEVLGLMAREAHIHTGCGVLGAGLDTVSG